jgi:phosphoglycolate phosphatase
MVKLIIFDLDGTLVNSLDDLAASVNHALRRGGFPEHPTDAYRHLVGNGVERLIERALPPGARDAGSVARVREAFMLYYERHRADLTAPYPGIPALLEGLAGEGILLAVASNKFDSATRAMTRLYFGDGLFRFVHGQREGVPVKPDPAILLAILGEAAVAPGEALYVGDSDVDMQVARNGGVRSIGVTWGFRSREELRENGACWIVDAPGEIARVVREMNGRGR